MIDENCRNRALPSRPCTLLASSTSPVSVLLPPASPIGPPFSTSELGVPPPLPRTFPPGTMVQKRGGGLIYVIRFDINRLIFPSLPIPIPILIPIPCMPLPPLPLPTSPPPQTPTPPRARASFDKYFKAPLYPGYPVPVYNCSMQYPLTHSLILRP